MRILGLDFGEHTVGVAVSDESGLIAQKVETIQRKFPDKLRQTLARIEELVSSYGVDKIILGYPKNMNNTEGERCEKTREFQALLERRSRLDGITIDMEKITFTDPDTQEETEFFCLEQTQINNQNYILVTEEEDGDSEAYILRETSFGQGETVYEMVDEDAELEAIGKVFAELMEDVDLEY